MITDTSGERRSTASLTYLVPLLSPTDGSPQQSGLRDLVDELEFDGNGSSARQSQLRTVQPPLWTDTGRPLQVRGPRLDQSLREEWLALGGLVIGGLLLILGQRMRWMLQKRRLRLEKIRRERLVNQRFRHTERELSRLLDQVQLGGDGTETMAFARLLKKHDTDPAAVTAEDRRLERLAGRFELVLQTGHAPWLFLMESRACRTAIISS